MIGNDLSGSIIVITGISHQKIVKELLCHPALPLPLLNWKPNISYGLIAWGHAANIHLNKVLILQKHALRLVYFQIAKLIVPCYSFTPESYQ